MANIQKTLDSLQPYVIGIRYLEGTPLVDAVFKEGWSVPEEPNIKRIKGDEGMNYYMIYSDISGIGLDELLEYVNNVIKLNQEREKKHELLKTKVNELKEIFKKNTLSKLTRLKFSFVEEELIPDLNDFDVDVEVEELENINPSVTDETQTFEEMNSVTSEPQLSHAYLDENGAPIELTDEEREILEEEARGERNRKLSNRRKNNPVVNAVKNIELPPKKKMVFAEVDNETDCECGPNDACLNCIDKKDL